MKHPIAVLMLFLPYAMAGTATAVPVQWAGNGHWYDVVNVGAGGINWSTARMAAPSVLPGGYLATSTSSSENAFIYSLVNSDPSLWYIDGSGNGIGPWLGGFQLAGSTEPAGGWNWVTGEPWSYTNWAPNEPNNLGGNEDRLHLFGPQNLMGDTWNDLANVTPVRGYLVESPVPEASSVVLTAFAILALGRIRVTRFAVLR